MSNSPKFHLSAIDRTPICIGITSNGRVYSFEEQAGRAAIVILAQNLATPGLIPLLAALA